MKATGASHRLFRAVLSRPRSTRPIRPATPRPAKIPATCKNACRQPAILHVDDPAALPSRPPRTVSYVIQPVFILNPALASTPYPTNVTFVIDLQARLLPMTFVIDAQQTSWRWRYTRGCVLSFQFKTVTPSLIARQASRLTTCIAGKIFFPHARSFFKIIDFLRMPFGALIQPHERCFRFEGWGDCAVYRYGV